MSDATPSDSGLVSGLFNTTQQVGGALGLAVLATLSTSRSSSLRGDGMDKAAALTGGYHLAFAVGAGLVAVSLVVALLVLRAAARPELGPERVPEQVADGLAFAGAEGPGELGDGVEPRQRAQAGRPFG
jgi:hypothetical protein